VTLLAGTKTKIDVKLIIVDEASMVNYDIWQDLLSFNLPILAIGDHGQLPPIEGKFNLMENQILNLKKSTVRLKTIRLLKFLSRLEKLVRFRWGNLDLTSKN